jgi:hypothetical protein
MTTERSIVLHHDSLEERAKHLRAQLATRIDAILDRTKGIARPAELVKRYAKSILGLAAIGGALIAIGVANYVVKKSRQSRRRGRDRVAAARRIWEHPEQVAHKSDPGVLERIAKNLLVSAATMLGVRVLRGAIEARRK